MLRLGNRIVPGFGLGATFSQAATDLQNQVTAVVVNAGDAYYKADEADFRLDFSDAVKAYQAAGQAGASSIGPEIDGAGAQTVTSPLTQQAWTINAQLAALTPSGAVDPTNNINAPYFTQADANQARSLVVTMVDLYNTAITTGAPAASQPIPAPPGPQPSPLPPPAPSSPSSPSSSSGTSSAWLWLIPVVAVGGIFVAVTMQKGPHHAHA